MQEPAKARDGTENHQTQSAQQHASLTKYREWPKMQYNNHSYNKHDLKTNVLPA